MFEQQWKAILDQVPEPYIIFTRFFWEELVEVPSKNFFQCTRFLAPPDPLLDFVPGEAHNRRPRVNGSLYRFRTLMIILDVVLKQPRWQGLPSQRMFVCAFQNHRQGPDLRLAQKEFYHNCAQLLYSFAGAREICFPTLLLKGTSFLRTQVNFGLGHHQMEINNDYQNTKLMCVCV